MNGISRRTALATGLGVAVGGVASLATKTAAHAEPRTVFATVSSNGRGSTVRVNTTTNESLDVLTSQFPLDWEFVAGDWVLVDLDANVAFAVLDAVGRDGGVELRTVNDSNEAERVATTYDVPVGD